MTDKRQGRASALFDDAAFAEDLNRASEARRAAALLTTRFDLYNVYVIFV